MTGRTAPAEQASALLDGADPRVTLIEETRGVRRLSVAADDLPAVVADLSERPGARVADLFASREHSLVLRAVLALDQDDEYVVLESEPEGNRMPWLSTSAPAFFEEECELYEQFGLLPASGHQLNRLAVAPVTGSPEASHEGHTAPTRDTHLPHTVAGPAFEFPVGPVRGAGAESLYYGLVTSGEEVIDLFLQSWHKYRGMERRLVGMSPDRAGFFVERSEGLSAASMATAYSSATEQALGIAVDRSVWRDRAICVELERLYNHAQCVAALAQATGLFVGQAQCEIAIEQLLRLNLAVAGHRYLFNAIRVGGGSGLDLDPLKQTLGPAADALRRVIDAVLQTNSFTDRLELCGVLTAEECRTLGLVGPIARASGATTDTRTAHPSLGVEFRYVGVPSHDAGDCLARLRVRREEVDASVELLGALMDGEFDRPEPDGEPHGWGLGVAESPRGEVLVWVETDPDHVRRVRLRTASARCWRGFDDAVRSQNVFTDIPIIEASFWLTAAGRTP